MSRPPESSGGSRRRRRPGAPRRGWSRLGLRNRVTLSFAFGALALSSSLAAITYFTTSSSLLHQEESTLEAQAVTNALTVAEAINSPTAPNLPIVLGQLGAGATNAGGGCSGVQTFSVVYVNYLEKPFPSSPNCFGQSNLPGPLVYRTFLGTPQEQSFVFLGQPRLAVGIPIPAHGSYYFAAFDLEELARTLHILLASLIVAAVVTTIAGAVLGRWAAGRALRPLRDVSRAALSIAGGRLDTRLETADASDLAVLASSFNRMADRLQQRIERDARFTSDVSHELRSPLTTLAAALTVIESRRAELPERAQKALDLLVAEVRRFQRMVGDLLEISRIDAGSADFQANLTEVGELVRRSAEAAGFAEVPVAMAKPVEHRQVWVEKRRFERILGNILENATRYAGGPTRIIVDGGGSVVRIAVEDDGPGVAPQDRDRIFERFARGAVAAGSRGTGGGTGLGLALVAEHVKLHRGRVWVEQRAEGGARFVVELPLPHAAAYDQDAFEAPASLAEPDDLGPPLPGRSGRQHRVS